MIDIVGSAVCDSTRVVSDPWIPLDINWFPD